MKKLKKAEKEKKVSNRELWFTGIFFSLILLGILLVAYDFA